VSVLFKALRKAADENQASGTATMGVPLIGGPAPSRRRGVSPVLLLLVLLVLGGGAAAYLFADDLAGVGDEVLAMVGAGPSVPAPQPLRPQPLAPPPAQVAVQAPAPVVPPLPAAVAMPVSPPVAPAIAAGAAIAPPATPAVPAAAPPPAPEPLRPEPARMAEPAPLPAPGMPRNVTPRGRTVGAPVVPEAPRNTELGEAARPPLAVDRADRVTAFENNSEQGLRVANRGAVTMSTARLQEAAYKNLNDGNYDAALKQYQEVLVRERDNRSALLGKAVALQRLQLNNSAQEVYEELLALDPGNRAAMANLLALSATQQPQQAMAQLERLEAANPTSAPIVAQLGMLHAQLGDPAKAARQMQLATALAPENPVYKLNLAILYDRAGRGGEALRLYQEVLVRAADSTQQLPMALDEVRRRVAYLGTVN